MWHLGYKFEGIFMQNLLFSGKNIFLMKFSSMSLAQVEILNNQ